MSSLLIVLLVLFTCSDAAEAAGRHYVHGYTRRDGTYVRPHYQTKPDHSRTNNYSYREGDSLSPGESVVPGTRAHRRERVDTWSLSPGETAVGVEDHRYRGWESSVRRDRHGRIRRSSSQRMRFLRSRGLTHTPRGCQVDHIVPLARGGADRTENMQLLCGEALRAKERIELRR